MQKKDLQTYFIDRIRELYDRKAIDSYRVSCHNSISLMKELKRLIERWIEKKVKSEDTVIACLQETITSLKKDTCIDYSFLNKELFLESCNEYCKSLSQKSKNIYVPAEKFLFLLKKCIVINEKEYLSRLLTKIESIIFSEEELEDKSFIPTIDELDQALKDLACQLLQKGYSKEFLYYVANNLRLSSFDDDFRKFKSMAEKEEANSYTVILRLNIPERINSILPDDIFIKEIDGDYKSEKVKAILKPGTSVRFYKFDTDCMDIHSAAKNARHKMALELDMLHLGMFRFSAKIDNNAAVLLKKNNGEFSELYAVTQYYLDGNYSDLFEVSKQFRTYLVSIKNNDQISNEVKDRFDSALRHLRVGNNEYEIEQRFINYWIALEFLFSSAYNDESTFTRLKENLSTVLSCCYAKRNLLDLNNILIKQAKIAEGEKYWEQEKLDDFIEGQSRILLKYRLLKMKARLFNKQEDIKNYITTHDERVKWHLIRLYKLRNELIHEAAIITDLESLTSNLRYYLVFLLNQMIVYFSNVPSNSKGIITMEDFFYEYSNLYKKLLSEKNLNCILSIPMEMNLLK